MGKKRGLIRRVDQLGRIVLPMEARKMLHIEEKDGLEILVDTDNGQIILQKVEDSCFLCRSTEDLKESQRRAVSVPQLYPQTVAGIICPKKKAVLAPLFLGNRERLFYAVFRLTN